MEGFPASLLRLSPEYDYISIPPVRARSTKLGQVQFNPTTRRWALSSSVFGAFSSLSVSAFILDIIVLSERSQHFRPHTLHRLDGWLKPISIYRWFTIPLDFEG